MQGLKAVSLTATCFGNVLPPSVDLPTKYCTLVLNGSLRLSYQPT